MKEQVRRDAGLPSGFIDFARALYLCLAAVVFCNLFESVREAYDSSTRRGDLYADAHHDDGC